MKRGEPVRKLGSLIAGIGLAFGAIASHAEIDLRNADRIRLDNGLTVILLEDRNFPVVSTQMLYRIGARDESYGQTGIAHFLEHMAFRDSGNFPDTGLVSEIYAVGGEWHGYTWTDQTTYFATVPKEHLDLLLRIEADRMDRLEISRDDMEAERGAVLAEMHMYENYPTSMLIDALMFASFQGHPYRNNTIGWESDIEGLQYEEVVGFYERFYQPANAVLAVVGDFDPDAVRRRIGELFGDFEERSAAPLPRTVEPPQKGERRVRLHGHVDDSRFMIAYRAPSANHPDFPAFLVLQEILGAGSGVNFRQNDWGTPVDTGSVLDGVANDVTTWFPPSAQDYIFIIGGSIAGDGDEQATEKAIEERIAGLRRVPPDEETLATAINEVLDDLAFDVQTTEDAAHQLAYFDGLGALDVLLELPQRIRAVRAAEVQRAAQAWLHPWHRTIGWYVPDGGASPRPVSRATAETPAATRPPPAPVDRDPVPPPVVTRLSGGVPAIVQPSDISNTGHLQVILRGNSLTNLASNDPILGFSSHAASFRPGSMEQAMRDARAAVDAAEEAGAEPGVLSFDPETRLEETFAGIMSGGAGLLPGADSPARVVISGDVEAAAALEGLETWFGADQAAPGIERPSSGFDRNDIEVHLGVPVAQAQLGYVVPAPGPTDEDAFAWRLLLYILSHDYEGRLGKEAISKRGLAYYIDSRYRSDGENGWVTLAVGVDPDKLAPLKALLEAELIRLRDQPPTAGEIEEAKRHSLGRARSAAQSNEELSSRVAEQWLWYGELLAPADLEARLREVSLQDVLAAIPAFTDGVTVVVER
jgi:zinc protease